MFIRETATLTHSTTLRLCQPKNMQQVTESTQQATGSTLMKPGALRRQVQHLNKLLKETRAELARQKTLKEMYINRGKATKKEVERLHKYSNAETLSTAKIATQVRSTIKRKKKKLLQVDYEELQVAHIISQDKSTTELQVEQQKNKVLQEELERIKLSHQELSLKYQMDVLTVRQQADYLRRELDHQVKIHTDKVLEDWSLIQKLKTEQDALRQKMAEEINFLQINAFEKEKTFWREMDELKSQLNKQVSLNFELSTELKSEKDVYQPPRRKRPRYEDMGEEPCRQRESIPYVAALKAMEKPEVSTQRPCMQERCLPDEQSYEPRKEDHMSVEQPGSQEASIPDPVNEAVIELLDEDIFAEELREARKKTSLWKKTRNFLRLKKPIKQK